jgi:hypothetical protein
LFAASTAAMLLMAAQRGGEVTILELAQLPFERMLGSELGAIYQKNGRGARCRRRGVGRPMPIVRRRG